MEPNVPATNNLESNAFRGLDARLPPFLKAYYQELLAKATVQKHPDSTPLLDTVLSLLPFKLEESLGFASSQIEPLVRAANEVCEGYEASKIPGHRITICDRRHVRVDLSPTYYDVVTNKDQATGPGFMPVEILSYSLGAVYARILRSRTPKNPG